MDKNKLDLIRKIILIVSIILLVILIPMFIYFLINPEYLIWDYSSQLYGSLYFIYVIYFSISISLIIGINFYLNRYLKHKSEKKRN